MASRISLLPLLVLVVSLTKFSLSQMTSPNVSVCKAETTNGSRAGTLHWPETYVSQTVTVACPSSSGTGGGSASATRVCVEDFGGATWLPPDTDSCAFSSPTTQGLELLAMMTSNGSGPKELIKISTDLRNLTANISSLTATDVQFIALTISSILDSASRNHSDLNQTVLNTVMTAILAVVSNLLELPEETVEPTAGAMIIRALATYIPALSVSDGSTIFHSQENIEVAVNCPTEIGSQAYRSTDRHTGGRVLPIGPLTSPAADSSKTTAFDLPEQALAAASVELRQSSTSSCGTAPTTFILYQTPALFRDTSMPRNTTVGSQVISAQVRGLNKSSRLDLAQPANMSFKLVNAPKQNTSGISLDVTCVFWDFNMSNGTGAWSSEGCRLMKYNTMQGRVLCQCDHLTNFACLVSLRVLESTGPPTVSERALSTISFVGCGLSMLGLIATSITIMLFKKLRKSAHQKFVLAVCLCLLVVLCLFVSGVERRALRLTPCRVIAVVLHFFTLVVFAALSADATVLYKKLVNVFTSRSLRVRRYFLSVFAIPTVIVSVTASVTKLDAYANDRFCWIVDRYVFYTAFIGPVAASVLYNFLVVIAISQSLWRDRKAEGPIKSKSRNKPVLYLTTVAALSVMLGLTWMFGLLVLFFDKPGMDYIFAILNSLQGVFIFVNTFRDGDVRAQWKARVTSIMSQQPTLTAHPYMTTVRYGRRNALQDGSVDTGTSGKGRAIVSPEVPDCLDRNKLGGSIATLSYEAQSTTV